MNQNEIELSKTEKNEEYSLDQLETDLEKELGDQMADLKGLEEDMKKIGTPEALGDTVMNVVWDQFINQIGTVAGEDFIKENRGLKLDLRTSAHVQTTDNFAKGNIATHNTYIDYQERYDNWQSKLEHDENGNVKTHTTRSGREVANVKSGARSAFDQGRPTGSAENGTDMDHTVAAAEIIRDPAAQAHLSEEEQIAFANSEANLHEMDAGQNRSKGDTPMNEWLDNPNSKGQKPDEIFDISEEQKEQYREKDKEAREEYDKVKRAGEERSKKTGKQSQKDEALHIGGKALRSVLMGLLASLLKDVIRQLIAWFRSGAKNLGTFLGSVKQAIMTFVANIKQHMLTAGNTLATTIATAIFGPVISVIKKAWIFLKQGYKSVKEAIKFLKDPANKSMPFSIKMMQVGKIIITGLTAGGAIVLGEVIEKGLMTIPVFAVQIPLLGSLASIIGIFLGAVVCGIIGALALNLIDRVIAKKLKVQNREQQIAKKNDVIQTQEKIIVVSDIKAKETKQNVANDISQRHKQGAKMGKEAFSEIEESQKKTDELHDRNKDSLDDINNLLNSL